MAVRQARVSPLEIYRSQYPLWIDRTRHISWLRYMNSPRQSRVVHNDGVFLLPVLVSTFLLETLLREPCSPFFYLLGQLRCLSRNLEIDGLDLHMSDYHNGAIRTYFLEFRQRLSSMLHGAQMSLFSSILDIHNRLICVRLSIPNILYYCKRFLMRVYLHFPKKKLYYSYLSASYALRSFPWARTTPQGFFRRGSIIS